MILMHVNGETKHDIAEQHPQSSKLLGISCSCCNLRVLTSKILLSLCVGMNLKRISQSSLQQQIPCRLRLACVMCEPGLTAV